MIIIDYLPISAIFISGFLIGIKVKSALINLENYISKRKKHNKF